MSRDEMIAVLINDTVENVLVRRQVFWLQKCVEEGFTGFTNWSDEELRHEMRRRGLEISGSSDFLEGDFSALESLDSLDGDGDEDLIGIRGHFEANQEARRYFDGCE